MHIPHSFRFEDQQEKIGFLKQHSFASMITNIDGIPSATLLPFAIDDTGGILTLRSHFSAANEQAKHIEESISLIIFNGPHAYISPAHYDKHESVPTWNYVTVHAFGKAKILHDDASKKNMLEQMISSYESSYQKQWNSLPAKFITGMMKGIVAFEIEVSRLEGQKKLSQNKTAEERSRIIASLSGTGHATEQELATYMHNLK
ncbi:FMN-binding negative transcriptional regulator [Terrimonas sp. NA20]|uniref:FMN-binding negative transcriptional regulator n=1 Tax=Terrimonas ginsenosidimutans TaxID=2908004 RepID=A0ABS9KQS2_9BACT|nr:FMN-binding negative transcriptional regulator [Terrimonas ginsenosidimutans]MCG2614656.1 FMN-binding negative transcriptional regulator [Terrimonas ginsenosidimutans]